MGHVTLRIGILGAARIVDDGIVEPARALGHEVVALAARDRHRAEVFADERGIPHVHDGYADVIADPDVDLVYNALVNSLHTKWNVDALNADKNVLSEKPLASNAAEAALVRQTARATGRTLVEGFHYLHHPISQRLRELVTSGALGEVERVEVVLAIPGPPDSDPRWSLDLAGGATMDLACYVLHAARQVGCCTSGEPRATSAEATLKSPQIDAGMSVELRYPDGIVADCRWDMAAAGRTMTWTSSVRRQPLRLRRSPCRTWTRPARPPRRRDHRGDARPPDLLRLPARRAGRHARARHAVPRRHRRLGGKRRAG